MNIIQKIIYTTAKITFNVISILLFLFVKLSDLIRNISKNIWFVISLFLPFLPFLIAFILLIIFIGWNEHRICHSSYEGRETTYSCF
jgi:hypothetical protein